MLLLKVILGPRTFENRPIWSHWMAATFIKCLSCLEPIVQNFFDAIWYLALIEFALNKYAPVIRILPQLTGFDFHDSAFYKHLLHCSCFDPDQCDQI